MLQIPGLAHDNSQKRHYNSEVHYFFYTPHLRLRRFTADDADHLFALDNDPEVMRYLNGGELVSRDAIVRDILPTFLKVDEDRPGLGFHAAEDRATAEFVGWFVLRLTGEPGEAALGYRLRREAWGRGLATEGARALVDWGFRELGLRRVVATTYEQNLASIRVMEKLGMTLIRRFRYTPEEIASGDTMAIDVESIDIWDGDDVEYGVTRETWRSLNGGHDA